MAGQRKSRYQKYRKKILILRMEEFFLCVIILFLMWGRGKSTAQENEAVSIWQETAKEEVIPDLSDEEIQSEYRWLEEHRGLFPDQKVESAEGNAGLIHFLYCYGKGDWQLSTEISLTEAELREEIPLFLQWDERWGYESYGDDNIGISGCAPTCLAMVAEGLTGNERITPKYVADYATKNGYYLYGTGTKWALLGAFAKEYHLSCKDLGKNTERILNELNQGHPVICSMGPGTFTRGGHFIVLCRIQDGKITVNDPNNPELCQGEWNLGDFSDEIKNAWSFAK